MDVPWLLVAHGSVTALVVVSFLCGQWPIFEGTFVQRINHFLTSGAYHHFLCALRASPLLTLTALAPLLSDESFAQAARAGGVRHRGQRSRARRGAVLLRPPQPDPAGTWCSIPLGDLGLYRKSVPGRIRVFD